MSPKHLLIGLPLSFACILAAFSPALAKPPKLSTAETNVSRCPEKEPGAPRQCSPHGGFTVIETKTEMSDFRLIVREGTGFQVFLEAAGCAEARYQGAIQWRQFDDQPFAVIQTLKCGESSGAAATKGKPAKSRTVVVVRGLAGFEGLHEDIDASKRKNATKDAIDIADRFLKGAWPKLEEQRVAAEASAQKQSDKETEAAAPAPEKVVPASQKRSK